jgi:hypothetical protein
MVTALLGVELPGCPVALLELVGEAVLLAMQMDEEAHPV